MARHGKMTTEQRELEADLIYEVKFLRSIEDDGLSEFDMDDEQRDIKVETALAKLEMLQGVMAKERATDMGRKSPKICQLRRDSRKPRLASVRVTFADDSFEVAHSLIVRLRAIATVIEERQFCYVFEQSGTVRENNIGKNFHAHIRCFIDGKSNAGMFAKEIRRQIKHRSCRVELPSNADALHSITKYMQGKKGSAEKLEKVEADVIWRKQNGLKLEYFLRKPHIGATDMEIDG